MATIFISYCREDIDLAKKIAKELQNQDHKVFIDLNILPGTEFPEKIVTEIQEADVFILLVTNNVQTSQYVNNELGFAHALYVKGMLLIIPIISGNAQLPSIIDKIQSIVVDENNINQMLVFVLQSISDFTKKEIVNVQKQNKDKNAVLNFLEKSKSGMERQQKFAIVFILICILIVLCILIRPSLQTKIPIPFYGIAGIMSVVIGILGIFISTVNKCISHCDIASLKCEIQGSREALSEATKIACLRSNRNLLLAIINN